MLGPSRVLIFAACRPSGKQRRLTGPMRKNHEPDFCLWPFEGEWVIGKRGKGKFLNARLHERLPEAGITHLVSAGVTAEVCVQFLVCEATDRDDDFLQITGAAQSNFEYFKINAIEMITAQGGIVGRAAASSALAAAFHAKEVSG